jgi:hypothetical protein
MKKFVMQWLPKVAVVVAGIVIAREVMPAYEKARASVANKVSKGA